MKVSIIGTAGRKEDAKKMTPRVFEFMVDRTENIIKDEWKLDTKDVWLVSGGAAWADHVAVRLFLTGEYQGLSLHMPAKWDHNKFVDEGVGSTANFYHQKFSECLGVDTLSEIERARSKGALLYTHTGGFFARNTAVSKSDRLIAFTWGEDEKQPKKGGTLNTWKQTSQKCIKIHQPLSSSFQSKKRKIPKDFFGPKGKQ